MTLILESNEPLIIAIDTTGSMVKRDVRLQVGAEGATPGPHARFDYARERVAELLERLPRDTEVTLLSFSGTVVPHGFAMSGKQASAALGIIEANGSESNTGLVLDWIWHSTLVQGQRRASLVIITDGEPSDRVRFEAYAHYNALQDNRLAVHILTVGDEPIEALAFSAIGRSERHSFGALASTELMVGKAASTPPGLDPARAPTQPPSVSPPSHPDNEYVQPKHAPKAKASTSKKGESK